MWIGYTPSAEEKAEKESYKKYVASLPNSLSEYIRVDKELNGLVDKFGNFLCKIPNKMLSPKDLLTFYIKQARDGEE
jgi:hypothetical protein